MTPDTIRTIRARIYHTQGEFAELLSRLRGCVVSIRTVEGWELESRGRAISFYKTDIEAIRRATKPRERHCDACVAAGRKPRRAVVHKKRRDLCGPCAAPKLSRRSLFAEKTA